MVVAICGLLGPMAARLPGQLHAGVGLQLGFSDMPNADAPIDRYNGRAFLYKPMNHFHWPFGEVYELSYRPGRALVSLNLNTRRMRATAKSTDANGIYQRDVRFAMQALSVGAGYAVVDEETFALYLGGALDGGYMRLLTRTGYEDQIQRTDYYLFARQPMLAATVCARLLFRAQRDAVTTTMLSPYFQFPFQTFNFQPLDQLLNQGSLTPANTPYPARAWNVGLSFKVDIDVLGFLMD